MPVVNGKEFPYSKKGMKDAARSRSKKSMKEKLAEKEKGKKRKGK